MSYTKGPWTISPQGRDLIHINVPKPSHYAGLMSVAVLDTQTLRSGDELISEEQMKANANLIAAAPEMLEALEACVDYIESLAVKTKSMNTAIKHDDFLNGHKGPFVDVYAVIKKAKGEL